MVQSNFLPVFTLEDHSVIGGLGDLLAECLRLHNRPNPLIKLGVEDQYLRSGDVKDLYKLAKIDVIHVASAVRTRLVEAACSKDCRMINKKGTRY